MISVVPLQRRCSLPSYEIGWLDPKLEGRLHDRVETQNDPYRSSKSATQNHLSKDGNIPQGLQRRELQTYITATKTGIQKNQTKTLGESITRVVQCRQKITDFSSVPNT